MTKIKELEREIVRLRLEVKVMREHINHLRVMDNKKGFDGFFARFTHDSESCEECTRLVATFLPEQPDVAGGPPDGVD